MRPDITEHLAKNFQQCRTKDLTQVVVDLVQLEQELKLLTDMVLGIEMHLRLLRQSVSAESSLEYH